MKAYKCDRCKKFFEGDSLYMLAATILSTFKVTVKVTKSGYGESPYELCKPCIKALVTEAFGD